MGEERRNSFDVIRLCAALAVAFGHQVDLAGRPEPSLGPLGISLSNTGLLIFFAISGYLVSRSLARDPRPQRFIMARLRRIYPGAMANAVACVLLGAVLTTLSQVDYWTHSQTWSYLVHGLIVVVTPTQLVLPGVFADARWPNVNTPIWTLKYELLCYAALLVLHRLVVPRLGAPVTLAVAAGMLAAGTAWHFASVPLPNAENFYICYNSFNLLRFGMTFAAGSLIAACECQGSEGWRKALFAVPAALVALAPSIALNRVGLILLLTLAAIELGHSPLLFSRRYRAFGDISYGVYLYAYPVQNLVMTRFYDGQNFWTVTAATFVIMLGCAVASWRGVEHSMLMQV